MSNDVYNPYTMGQQNINRQQDYYGPGYYQQQHEPIRYNNMPPVNMGGGYNPNIGNTGVVSGGQQGYGGMNSGYYGGPGGGGYYNPYLAQRKREREMEEFRKQEEYQSNIMKRLSKNSHSVMGVYSEDEFEKHASQYDPHFLNMSNEDYIEQNKMQNLARVHEIGKMQGGVNHNEIQTNMGYDRVNKEIDKTNKKYGLSDDMSMMEFFDIAGNILLDQKIEKTKRNRRNVGGMYDRNSYGKLIDVHSGKHNYFNNINDGNSLGRLKHHNIDDMEVQLPPNMSDKYTDRKNKFIQQLLNGE